MHNGENAFEVLLYLYKQCKHHTKDAFSVYKLIHFGNMSYIPLKFDQHPPPLNRYHTVCLLRGTLSAGGKGGRGQCTLVPVPEVVCLEYGKHFSAKRGLTVHTTTAYHSERTASIWAAIGAQTKRRWDEEGLAGMAMEEARLRRNG